MGSGELAALGAALLWTVSSMFWNTVRLTAWHINLCKCAIGSILVGGNVLVVSWLYNEPISVPLESWGWLGFSGLIGIVAGDTFYFRSLQILGPRRSLMMATSSPVFTVLFGWLLLNEKLLPIGLAGIGLVVAGVLIVLGDKKAPSEQGRLMPGTYGAGIAAGLTGAACNAIGVVLSKIAMTSEVGPRCGFLEATWIRLFVSGLMILLVVVGQKQLFPLLNRIRQEKMWTRLLWGTVLGTWLGIGASMYAFRETSNIAIAQTLTATCPLFAIPVCWFLLRQPATLPMVAGTLIAIFGIWLAV
jgi:drug/metabolite transporter (DMT)-like permease